MSIRTRQGGASLTRLLGLICALCMSAALASAAIRPLSALAKAPPSTGNAVVSDCYRHGRLTQQYSRPELVNAEAVMPSYIKQYSNCETVIQNALNDATGLADTGSGKSGSSISTALVIVVVVVMLAILVFGGLLIARRRRHAS